MGVPTSKRIRNQKDFQKIRSLGEQVFGKSFICQYHFSSSGEFSERRLGVIASRRVGNAVKRNRGKRIIRELFRMHETRLPQNCDIVIILRSNYSNSTYKELESQYLNTCMAICKNQNVNRND